MIETVHFCGTVQSRGVGIATICVPPPSSIRLSAVVAAVAILVLVPWRAKIVGLNHDLFSLYQYLTHLVLYFAPL